MNHDKSSNYKIILTKDMNQFYLTIPELVLSVSGTNLQETYNELVSKKKEALNSIMNANLASEIPIPDSSSTIKYDTRNKGLAYEFIIYLMKILTTGILFLGVIVILYQLSHPVIERTTLKIKLIPNELLKIPEEKITKATKLTKQLMKKFSPIVDELKEFDYNEK
jgi:hypothetical protein